ncbi:MAG TPA: nitronate monooxygenase [Microthrixaceae bacterium]|nr:nitronate monooxygenase [Microthrixaceae bacterium]HMX06260.1 nitronate monooxygenase [Microthrixaceae bacterium]HMX64551.1 nitronate monooxygenase [Microthrixaceae bacterium]HMY87165.1 nitronate monooxygenase [Microthrixaceae bacterium]HNA36844.1 nitronate monooxygenase [Microthrixaceae bacterium]
MTDAPRPGSPDRFTGLVGCRVAIQLAAMGAVSTPALAGAVAGAGGLGMLSGTALPPDELDRQLSSAVAAAAGGGGAVGVGFLMPFLDVAAFEAAASAARLVECFYGDPDADLARRAHDAGALLSWQVGSLDEALRAVDAGCDLVVLQGTEAGGHVRGASGLIDLVSTARPRLEVPVIAAGGIGTPERATEALAAGADAVRVGTRFLAATEADVHPGYLAALVAAGGDDTTITEAFSGGWPNAPHRVLISCVTASDADPLTRSVICPTRGFTGDVTGAALYAGRSVGAVTGETTAAAIVDEFAAALGRR